jgi:hypothetical protein
MECSTLDTDFVALHHWEEDLWVSEDDLAVRQMKGLSASVHSHRYRWFRAVQHKVWPLKAY